MPQIPSRPDFEQLKQQAKDLHRAYRAGDDQALARVQRTLPAERLAARFVLADAQFVLAHEYGFASWPKLKQHVAQLVAAQAAVRPPDPRQERKRVRQQQVAARAAELVAAASARQLDAVFAALFAPLWEMEAVRALLVAQEAYTLIIDALLDGVDHPQPRVRFLTAQAMDHFADQRCAAPLLRMLHDQVPRVRWAALHSLQCETCKLTPLALENDIVATLIDMALHDPSIKVRRTATYELGTTCADPRARAALEQLVAAADATVVRNARWALRQTN